MEFLNRKIAVLGLGIEGYTSAQFLAKHGGHVTVFDQQEEKHIEREWVSLLRKQGIILIFGPDAFSKLEGFDIILRSPGIHSEQKDIQKAKEKGAVITSQIKIFFDLCPCKIIGVTGTKGKGTTSSLIYEMLKKDGKDVYLGGNIGNPPFTFLDTLTDQSFVVLELSSFQLLDLTVSPHIAVMLMTTSEHLDYHKDTKEYIEAKRNILRFQKASDFAVLNRDYPATNESDICTDGEVFFVSREREVEKGCWAKAGKIYFAFDSLKKPVIDVKDILLPGRHNFENVCAASTAAFLAHVSIKSITSVLREFKGLEHRLELVGNINGVRYYDDSFSTTPETAIAAIESFEDPEILVLGGSSKESNFSELGELIAKTGNIKAIIGMGKEWERIKASIPPPQPFIIEGATTMQHVVSAAAKIAVPGDVVLLSPACASFDMFKNYKDRGEQFKDQIGKLVSQK